MIKVIEKTDVFVTNLDHKLRSEKSMNLYHSVLKWAAKSDRQ